MVDAAFCPGCGTIGRKVELITLRSLLSKSARGRLVDTAELRFCKVKACDVVYYSEGGERFGTGDLQVPVFQKSADPSRFVCYCFGHRVEDIEREVASAGASVVPDQIAGKCRRGLDRCEEMNPQGACCLGNVRQVVKAAMSKSSASSSASGALADCCATDEKAEPRESCCAPAVDVTGDVLGPRRNAGLWSAGGAVVAALLSSACCWLPLLLIAVGASAAGVAGFFEAYRAYFLGGTSLLLGVAFYFVYVRKPRCAPGEACEVPNLKLQRLNKIALWTATVSVLMLATFPSYVGFVLGEGDSASSASSTSTEVRTYTVDGMTCESCVPHVEEAIEEVQGVVSADVSYSDETARVDLSRGASVKDSDVAAAVEALGYRAQPLQAAGSSN